MKNTLAILLALIPSLAISQIAEEIRIQQRDATNTNYFMRTFGSPPSGGNTGLLTIDGSSRLPQYYIAGTGISFNTTAKTINVTGFEPTITGSTSDKYWAGDKTWKTFPTALSDFTNDLSFVTSSDLSTSLSNYAQLSQLSAGLATKFDTPTGTTSQYIRGDGSLATLPAPGSGTVTSIGLSSSDLSVSGSPVTTSGSITANLTTTGVSAGTYTSVTVDTKGRVTAGANLTFTNNPSRSIVTTAASANGFQLSSSKSTYVSYSITIGTSISLAGASAGYAVLEIAATNSSTASDWQEISRVSSGSSGGVIVGVSIGTTGGGPLVGIVPPGYYARIRSVSSNGTPSFTYNSGQEVTH